MQRCDQLWHTRSRRYREAPANYLYEQTKSVLLLLSFALQENGLIFLETSAKTAQNVEEAFINTAKNFGLADRKIDGFGDALKGFDGLQLLGIKLSDLGDTLDFNVGIFKQLSQTGAGFGKSVINLRNAATSANMPILDFVDPWARSAPP